MSIKDDDVTSRFDYSLTCEVNTPWIPITKVVKSVVDSEEEHADQLVLVGDNKSSKLRKTLHTVRSYTVHERLWFHRFNVHVFGSP